MNYDFKLSINGQRLYPSNCIKYLGVLLDSDLSWKSQANAIAAKLKRANGALAKIRHLVPKYVLLQVYYSVFHFHLQYCCQIWGQPTCSQIKRIASLQNTAIRLMSFETQRTPSSPLYARFGILKMSDMVHLQNILLLHSVYHNKTPDSIQNTFAVNFSHAHDTCANNIGSLNLPMVDSVSFFIACY